MKLPLVACAPVHAPEAVQAVALALDHVSVLVLPLATLAGVAVSVAVGVMLTVTLDALLLALPDVQVMEYVAGAVNGPVLCVPLVARPPVQLPAAVHAVAPVLVQLNVAEPPLAIVALSTVKLTVGIAAADGVDPPPPQAVSVAVSSSDAKAVVLFIPDES